MLLYLASRMAAKSPTREMRVAVDTGGTFTDWKGNRTIHAGEGAATNGLLAKEVQRILAAF